MNPCLCERIAGDIHDRFDTDIHDMAYALSLDDDGNIRWSDRLADGSEIVHAHDPNTSQGSRVAVTVIGWLPVRWLL